MLSNKTIIGIGALLFSAVAIGYIMIGLQQRQTTRPDAQSIDVYSCPLGTVKPDPETGLCEPGSIPIPIYPSGGGQQLIDSGSLDGGSNISSDIGPTSLIQSSPTPTKPVLGFCCIPLTPTQPVGSTPTPTTIPDIPTPTSCPGGGEQLTVDSQAGCSSTNRCDFSVTTDGSGNILTRSLWSDGSFSFGTLDQDVTRLNEQTFAYGTAGTYDVSLTCTDTATVCTKQITITDPGICNTPTPTSTPTPTPSPSPSPTQGVPTPSPTPPACRVPMPTLIIRCPNGCPELK